MAAWWNIAINSAKAEPIEGASLSIDGLVPGEYRVEWWDTTRGKVISEQTPKAMDKPIAVPRFTGDIACRITRRPG